MYQKYKNASARSSQTVSNHMITEQPSSRLSGEFKSGFSKNVLSESIHIGAGETTSNDQVNSAHQRTFEMSEVRNLAEQLNSDIANLNYECD